MHVLRTITTALLVMLGCPALLGPCGIIAAWSAEDELLQGAAQRIEEHRKSDAALVVVDTAGKPLPDVQVTVEQTRHQFLFGCNFFQFGKAPQPAGRGRVPHPVRRSVQLRHVGVLLAVVRIPAGAAAACVHGRGGQVVPGPRHHHQGPSLGVELLRAALAAG